MRKLELTVTIMAVLLAAYGGNAQTVPPPEPPAPAAPAAGPAAYKLGSLDVSGMIDGYYSLGFNHPAGHVSSLRNFDDKTNQMELNMASLTVDYSLKPVGVHLDVGVGRAFDIMSATEKDATGMRFFKQAYVIVKPASWRGLELDFGRFVTFASAEVVETPGNWNYSRSLLYVWCTPYYHFGLRATAPIGKRFNTGVQLVSGWNNILTGATFRTVGLTGSWTPTPKATWTNTYYSGPDENRANRGARKLYDTVLLLSPNSRTNLYINFDYLHNRPKYSPGYTVYGIAGAARFQLTKKFSLSPRAEWLNDDSGMATGTGQQVKEFTVTGTYTFSDRISGWLEFRNDWSDQFFFNRGGETAVWKKQPTLVIGLVAFVRPKR